MYYAVLSAACYAADSCHGRLKRCKVICSVISGGARVFACALQFLSVHRDLRPCCWLQDALDNLESNLKPFLNKAPRELEQNVSLQSATIKSRVHEGSSLLLPTECPASLQLSALERAELHGVLAEAHAALFAMYLQAQGANPEDHPFAKEKVSSQSCHSILEHTVALLSANAE